MFLLWFFPCHSHLASHGQDAEIAQLHAKQAAEEAHGIAVLHRMPGGPGLTWQAKKKVEKLTVQAAKEEAEKAIFPIG